MTAKRKLGLLLWGAGLLGVIAMVGLVFPRLIETLPEMLGDEPLPLPPGMLVVLSLVQSSVLLALAVWAGVALSPAVGLRAPAFEAAVMRQSVVSALRPQLVPGVLAGIVGGAMLIAFWRFAPPQILAAQERVAAMPLIVRVLYGGITEELLLRWGFMTLLVWLAWRFFARASAWVWVAIVVSALVFALGHLPAAVLLVGPLNATIIAYVTVGNALFGIVFGWLFWRYGLEAAILAHALTHVVKYVVSG